MSLKTQRRRKVVECDFCPLEYYNDDPSKPKPRRRAEKTAEKPEDARALAREEGFVRVGMKFDACKDCAP